MTQQLVAKVTRRSALRAAAAFGLAGSCLPAGLVSAANAPSRTKRAPPGGILFYAKHGFAENTAAVAHPHVAGVWAQFYWSEIEPEPGRYDWNLVEARMRPWLTVGKKAALRVYWIGSGNWPDPAAKHSTPAWVWREGAKFAYHEPSKTEIPLPWDPIYRKFARRFLEAAARKFDHDPNVLFFDVTPGAETNPYRFLALNRTDPMFKDRYADVAASDGRKYSDALWLETVRDHVDFVAQTFTDLPALVTLNVGSLQRDDRRDHAVEIGNFCVDRGLYVGQNGLSGTSYKTENPRRSAFLEWSKSTKVFFETLGDAGTTPPFGKQPLGSLREIIDAALRAGASYLLPYPRDVLRGTPGQPDFQSEFATALEYGATTFGRAPA